AWLATHSAGSGPYQIRKVVMHQVVLLSANPTSPAGAPKMKRRKLEETQEFNNRRSHPDVKQVFRILLANWQVVIAGMLMV
ncbi:hypothetical protein HZD82_26455, partial [Pantoea agglomerans]|nr:hypothetical protein [Pantoea agglomerans]